MMHRTLTHKPNCLDRLVGYVSKSATIRHWVAALFGVWELAIRVIASCVKVFCGMRRIEPSLRKGAIA